MFFIFEIIGVSIRFILFFPIIVLCSIYAFLMYILGTKNYWRKCTIFFDGVVMNVDVKEIPNVYTFITLIFLLVSCNPSSIYVKDSHFLKRNYLQEKGIIGMGYYDRLEDSMLCTWEYKTPSRVIREVSYYKSDSLYFKSIKLNCVIRYVECSKEEATTKCPENAF